MAVDYKMAAANAITGNASLMEVLSRPDELMADVKDGDLMACVTLRSGAIGTIACARLRIVGPRCLCGLFQVVWRGMIYDDMMLNVYHDDIADIDYFVM